MTICSSSAQSTDRMGDCKTPKANITCFGMKYGSRVLERDCFATADCDLFMVIEKITGTPPITTQYTLFVNRFQKPDTTEPETTFGFEVLFSTFKHELNEVERSMPENQLYLRALANQHITAETFCSVMFPKNTLVEVCKQPQHKDAFVLGDAVLNDPSVSKFATFVWTSQHKVKVDNVANKPVNYLIDVTKDALFMYVQGFFTSVTSLYTEYATSEQAVILLPPGTDTADPDKTGNGKGDGNGGGKGDGKGDDKGSGKGDNKGDDKDKTTSPKDTNKSENSTMLIVIVVVVVVVVLLLGVAAYWFLMRKKSPVAKVVASELPGSGVNEESVVPRSDFAIDVPLSEVSKSHVNPNFDSLSSERCFYN